jgi:hypothetical protein
MSFSFIELKQITNFQRRRLRDEVLLKRYDRASLKRLLTEDLGGRTLEQISSDSNFITQCDEVLGWFSDNNLAGKFCDAVRLEFPQQQGLLEQILSDTSTGFHRSPLRDYLYLFDRADQETLFLDALSVFPEQSPVPPVVVVISGLPDDEADLMLVRIMQRAIPALYGAPYQKTVPHMLNWVTTVSVVKLVRELANKILGVSTLRDSVDDLIAKMKDRIAGQTVCMTLPAHLINPQNAQILGEFFGQWSRLGVHERPPIFFLLMLGRDAQDASPEDCLTPADAYAAVKKACTPSGELVTVVDHLALNLCDPNHIRIWRSDLDETPIEKNLIKSACDILEMKLGDQTTFRLRRVKSELGTNLG